MLVADGVGPLASFGGFLSTWALWPLLALKIEPWFLGFKRDSWAFNLTLEVENFDLKT